jgi:hypothetical protein
MYVNIMVGLPMCGKTELAKKLAHAGEVVVDCDDIRMMLTKQQNKFKAFNPNLEPIVWGAFRNIIKTSHESGVRDLTIANTNCNLALLKDLLRWFDEEDIKYRFILFSKFDQEFSLNAIAKYYPESIDKMYNVVTRMYKGYCEVERFVKNNNFIYKEV